MNLALYLTVVLIWGTTWIAIAMQRGPVAAPVSIFWRFALASSCLWLILVLSRTLKRLNRRDHLFCLLQGCCVFGFNFYCLYTAAAYISSGLESVIFSMAVLFNALNARFFFGQPLKPQIIGAALLGGCGILALFWRELCATSLSTTLPLGVGLCLLGAYGFSLGNMISTRHQRRGLDTLSTNAWAMLYGALVMGLIALLRGERFMPELNLRYLGALSYLAIFGSVIAFGAYFKLVGRIGASQAAYSSLLIPLVALTVSTVCEGYVWHPNAVAGLAMILAGNLVMFARPGRGVGAAE
ncbi:DMT family transporter [Niveibacterium terrae]|uniref:DMT family transporter n=1 Tax=Niveibacterium terrae TaxID=3373598 RepID=UPI003A8ECD57